MAHAKLEVIRMWRCLVLLLFVLSGCQSSAVRINDYTIYGDRNYYYQQSVVHPLGLEPNATPYGTPANAGANSDYNRTLRPDAISDYFWPRR